MVDVIEPVKTPAEVSLRFDIDLGELLKEHRKQVLETLSQSIEQTDSVIYTRVLSGIPFAEVIKFVQSGDFDLLIKMARPPAGISEKLSAVDTNSSETQGCDDLIMQLATSLSKRENAEIDIVHAWELPYESTFRSGRFRMAEVELKLLLTLEADRHKARLHALLERYDIPSMMTMSTWSRVMPLNRSIG